MNMSYCRFQNTVLALQQCQADWDGDGEYPLSRDEQRAKKQLIQMCRDIAEMEDEEDDDDTGDDEYEYIPILP